MSDTFCEIDISDIDLNDDRYKISPGIEDITFLADSIKKIGLITPPVVRQMNNRFIIVSGFGRIRALYHNNEKKAVVHLIDKQVDDYHCLLLAIAALAFKRPLSHVELIVCVQRLSEYLNKEEMAKISSAVFNTQLTQDFIGDLIDIGSLPKPSLELILSGHLSLKSAKKLSTLDMDSTAFFLDIFSKIRATVSIQFEIIQNILEISAREGFLPKSIFLDLKTPNPLDDETCDLVLRTQRFRTIVFEQRYPTLSRARQLIKDKIAATKLPGTIKLIPPENFEGRGFSVSFIVKNHEEFKKNVQNLTEVLENNSLREILNS